jgi:hypothetical protein
MSQTGSLPDDRPTVASAAVPGVGILAQPSYHVVDLTRTQDIINHAGELAAYVQGASCDGKPIQVPHGSTLPIMALDRLAVLLEAAAVAVREQRAQASGWPAV